MDYKILLKNLSLTELMRIEIEQKLNEVKDLSSGYLETAIYISKVDESFIVSFGLVREDRKLVSIEGKSDNFSEALEDSKNSLLENILKEFILSAS